MTERRRPTILLPRMLRRPGAAAYLSVSETTLDQWVADGIVPAPVKVRGCTLYDREGLDRAMDAVTAGEGRGLEFVA